MRRTIDLALAASVLTASLAALAFSQALKPTRPDLGQLADGRQGERQRPEEKARSAPRYRIYSRLMSQPKAAAFTSHTNARGALQELLRACLEWPPDVVADELSQALIEEQAPDAMLARTTHQGVVRLINHYLRDPQVPDDPPEWLTLLVTDQVLQRLRLRAQ